MPPKYADLHRNFWFLKRLLHLTYRVPSAVAFESVPQAVEARSGKSPVSSWSATQTIPPSSPARSDQLPRSQPAISSMPPGVQAETSPKLLQRTTAQTSSAFQKNLSNFSLQTMGTPLDEQAETSPKLLQRTTAQPLSAFQKNLSNLGAPPNENTTSGYADFLPAAASSRQNSSPDEPPAAKLDHDGEIINLLRHLNDLSEQKLEVAKRSDNSLSELEKLPQTLSFR